MDSTGDNENIAQLDQELAFTNINKLFVKYGFSTLIGQVAQAIMVILEGIFIGRGLGALGLATVSVIMPLELLNTGLGGALGIGISTVSALDKGRGNLKRCQKIFSDGFWFTLIVSTVIALIISLNADSIAIILGAKADIHRSTVTFIRVFMAGYPFAITGQMIVSMLRVDEKPGLSSWIMSLSALFAIIELYYGIFVAKWGIVAVGIYYAMAIGLFFGGIFYFLFSKTKLKIKFDFKFDWPTIFKDLKIASPYFLITISSSIFTWVMNIILSKNGNSVDVAAFGIVNGYIFYILNIISVSLTQGMQPIASYNYGAKLYDRNRQLLNISIISNVVIIALITLLYAVFARPLISIFARTDQKLIDTTLSVSLIMVGCTALGSTVNILAGYYQAINKIKISTFLGVIKFLIIATPLQLILNAAFGPNSVWFSQPIADIIVFGISLFLWKKETINLRCKS
ncbi:MATE family efflux transporter [Xylocopilactobacillus apicola]|uniref:MATE family efflux transporter n=1 Tax=Xylocopilactobacillus apicola TaxID=2932184 RepID=A0AAU9CVR4_9LACO|nr:MATE family efflux transporter [Xylocopilactobacillus apicola]BDR58087.1 MATE family efflux transporter [Xylocopilactobacillus apicola]